MTSGFDPLTKTEIVLASLSPVILKIFD